MPMVESKEKQLSEESLQFPFPPMLLPALSQYQQPVSSLLLIDRVLIGSLLAAPVIISLERPWPTLHEAGATLFDVPSAQQREITIHREVPPNLRLRLMWPPQWYQVNIQKNAIVMQRQPRISKHNAWKSNLHCSTTLRLSRPDPLQGSRAPVDYLWLGFSVARLAFREKLVSDGILTQHQFNTAAQKGADRKIVQVTLVEAQGEDSGWLGVMERLLTFIVKTRHTPLMPFVNGGCIPGQIALSSQ
ncbi:hypothetical protein BJX99DRAFT_261439 [Aspergillus californicus]